MKKRPPVRITPPLLAPELQRAIQTLRTLLPHARLGVIALESDDSRVVVQLPPEPSPGAVVTLPSEGIAFEDIERAVYVAALERSHWVQARAAELLRLSPRVLHYRLKVLKISAKGG